MNVSGEKNNPLYLRAEKELDAHIWWFCSTIEYFKTTEYEPPTPSQLEDRVDCFFRGAFSDISFIKSMIL